MEHLSQRFCYCLGNRFKKGLKLAGGDAFCDGADCAADCAAKMAAAKLPGWAFLIALSVIADVAAELLAVLPVAVGVAGRGVLPSDG